MFSAAVSQRWDGQPPHSPQRSGFPAEPEPPPPQGDSNNHQQANKMGAHGPVGCPRTCTISSVMRGSSVPQKPWMGNSNGGS
eukprot:352884-Chlamydomonas_euryale.AAC.7